MVSSFEYMVHVGQGPLLNDDPDVKPLSVLKHCPVVDSSVFYEHAVPFGC